MRLELTSTFATGPQPVPYTSRDTMPLIVTAGLAPTLAFTTGPKPDSLLFGHVAIKLK